MSWPNLLLTVVGLIAAAIMAVVNFRNLNIISRPRATLRTNLEILKLIELTDEKYHIVKEHIDSSIQAIYQEKLTLRERLRVYDWSDLLVGIAFFGGFSWWTIELASRGSLWSILTGYFALSGLILLVGAFQIKGKGKRKLAYNTVKPQIQNAVTAFTVEHNGALPPTTGYVALKKPPGNFGILDICAVVGEKNLLRKVPYGTNSQNCVSGCSTPGGSYIWLIDQSGNVYSTCVHPKCKEKSADGYQGIWP